MLSPPALSLLTIGSFATLYTSWFNCSKSNKEIPLFISDILLDLLITGVGTLGVEWFYLQGMKIFSWVISIFPIVLVISVTLLVIIIRIKMEKKMSIMKIIEKPLKITLDEERKINERIAKV